MPQKSHSSQIALDTLYNQMQNLEIIMVKVTQCELREQNESCNYTPWPCGNVRNRVDPVLLKSSDQGYTLYIFETFWENIRQISRFFEIMTKSVHRDFYCFHFFVSLKCFYEIDWLELFHGFYEKFVKTPLNWYDM